MDEKTIDYQRLTDVRQGIPWVLTTPWPCLLLAKRIDNQGLLTTLTTLRRLVTRPKKWISVPLGWPQLPGLCSFSKLEFHWVSILYSFDVILQSLKLGRDKNLRFEGNVWREGPIVAALCGVVILWWLNLPWTATGKIQRLWDPTGCGWKPYDIRWYSKAPDLRPNFWLAQTPWLICVDFREVAACLSGLFRV